MRNRICLLGILVVGLSCTPLDLPRLNKDNVMVDARVQGRSGNLPYSVWDEGDALGIYVKKKGSALSSDAIALNKRFVIPGFSVLNTNNLFVAESDEHMISLPKKGTVDFIGYYPYREGLEELEYEIDVTNQANQREIDFLYSDDARAVSVSDSTVAKMTFRRPLSKMLLYISVKEEAFDLSGWRVAITDADAVARFSLISGELGDALSETDIWMNTDESGNVAEAVLLPMKDVSRCSLLFTNGSEVFTAPLGKENGIASLLPGMLHTYYVVLDAENNGVSVIQASLQGWAQGPEENIVAVKNPHVEVPKFPGGSGTERDPYLPSTIKEHLGEKQVWVSGYIVGTVKGQGPTYYWGVENAKNSSLAVAVSPQTSNPDEVIPVQLPAGTIRAELNLQDNPHLLGKRVLLRGDVLVYYGGVGVKNVKEGVIVD